MNIPKSAVPAKLLLIFFLSITMGSAVLSQETGSCAEKLQTAQNLFERGQVELVPSYITGCLETGFTREESLAAYKLLIQSLLFDKKIGAADSIMFEFLKKNPEYQVSPADHSSFISLFNNFISRVIIQTSVHVGLSMPFVFISESNSLFGLPGEKKYNSGALNFFIALDAKYKLTSRIELNAEAGYSQFSFTNNENVVGFADKTFIESQSRIEIPLSVTYDITKWGKLVPYARLGAGPSLIMKTTAVAEVNPTDPNNPFDRSGSDLNLAASRTFLDVIGQAGVGIKVKTRGGWFFGELRSNFGITSPHLIQSYKTENDDMSFFYMHGDDTFRNNVANFHIGYTWIFYKPERREE